MAKLQCEICGGSKLLKQGDLWVCQDCGCQYTEEDVKKMFQAINEAPDSKTILEKKKKGKTSRTAEKVNKDEEKNNDFTIVAGTLTAYNGSSLNVVIPDGVIEIGQECFDAMDHLISVAMPNTLKVIGYSAFRCCDGLKTIEFPKGLEEIGIAAFEKCTGLTEIVIPDSVKKVEGMAFCDCSGLKKVVLSKDTIVEESAFRDCNSLEIIIGGGKNASAIVKDVKHLVSVKIVEGEKEIPTWAFKDSSLSSIELPESLSFIGSEAFFNCKNLISIRLPGTLTSIATHAFALCSNLCQINIPNHVSIDNEAFLGCTSLTAETQDKLKAINKKAIRSGACYIATCIYGSYDCPEVWILRRYRDNTLGSTWCGRLFIHFYYAIAPILVNMFGETEWFRSYWRKRLDRKVAALIAQGVESTPYEDKDWRK